MVLNQSSSDCGGSMFPLSYRGLSQSSLIKAVLMPHGLSKECLLLIKKGESFLGEKIVFEGKKVPICKMLLFEKKLDAL